MSIEPGLAVTLSADLLRQLRAEARKLGLPLEWLVASLVVDTVEPVESRSRTPAPALACV